MNLIELEIIHDKYISLSIKTNPFSELETRTDPATEKYTGQVRYDNRSSSSSNSNTLQIHEENHEENVVPLQVIQSIEKFSKLKDFSDFWYSAYRREHTKYKYR